MPAQGGVSSVFQVPGRGNRWETMWRGLRENAPCALLAALGCVACGWLALYGIGWNDYGVEAQPAFEALTHGHVLLFLQLSPVYGGSLIERAPFALLPGVWGGGSLAVYRMTALPCLLACAALGTWIVADMRRAGRAAAVRAVALCVCVANPVTLAALETGHPEELLGASLCAAAALLACSPSLSRRRAIACGMLLGLAIANKQWALVAIGPVALALPPERRKAFLLSAFALAAAILAPLLLASASHFAAGARAAAAPGATIFQPWQVWWFFGHHGAAVHGLFGEAKPGYRTGPAWTAAVSHPAVLAAGALVTLALWPRARHRRLPVDQTLLALSLVLLARCLLDTWDTSYYALPFLFALLACEVRSSPRLPVLSLGASVLVWLTSRWLPQHASADLQAAAFLAWSLPLALWLGGRLATSAPSGRLATSALGRRLATSALGRRLATSAPRPRPQLSPIRASAAGGAQETTVSSLPRPVRTSGSPERTTTRSSIRTPSESGR